MTESTSSTNTLFAGKDAVVRDTYTRILDVLHGIGPFHADAKKTSIHLTNGARFAGIHPRKSFLHLTARLDRPIESDRSDRIVKSEQVSTNRFHNEVKLSGLDDVDEQLMAWLREAYPLTQVVPSMGGEPTNGSFRM